MGGNFVHWTNSFLWRETRRHGLRISKGLDPEVIYWVTGGEVRSNTPEEYLEMSKFHGRLWFAGGDIAEGFPSLMDGAIESGTLAAESVLKSPSA